MATRALIIGIEQYPKAAGGMEEPILKGVVHSAKSFRDWLVAKSAKDKVADTQIFFCSNPVEPDGLGASAKEIRKALKALVANGQGMTEELFFYFAGHGFRFEQSMGNQSDVLVGAGYEGEGDECIQLDEIIRWLSRHLGKGRHYFFVDACRNVLDRSKIQISDSLPWDPKVNGEASSFIIQSTVAGRTAFAEGGFSPLLIAGLKGGGKAKRWADDISEGMKVTFSSLFDFLEAKLQDEQSVDQRTFGSGLNKAVFAVLNPPDPARLSISVRDLPEGKQAILTLTRTRNNAVSTEQFRDTIILKCPPDTYAVDVIVEDFVVVPAGKQKIELFEPEQSVAFAAEPPSGDNLPPLRATDAEPELAVAFATPEGATLEIRGIDNALRKVASEAQPLNKLPIGRYETKLISREGVTLLDSVVKVTAESAPTLSLPGTRSVIHNEIARKLPNMGAGPQFSETLGGGMDDPDPNVWLTLLGGGKIIGSNGRFSKISQFKLHDFSVSQPGVAGVYCLAAFNSADGTLRAALGGGPEVNWIIATSPDELPSLREVFIESQPGPRFVSLQINQFEPVTIASSCIPNRITLFVITLDEKGEAVVNQFILPLGHLVSHLPQEVQVILERRNQLEDLKTLAQIARAFRKRKELREEFKGNELAELLWVKWLDPVGAAMAAYELIRRGDNLNEFWYAAENLEKYFPEFPDGPALGHLARQKAQENDRRNNPYLGKQDTKLNGIPMFLDGWLAVRSLPDAPEAPKGTLDFNASLTTWLGIAKE